MKRIGKNILLIAFGFIIAIASGVYAAITASQVQYTNNSQSTVSGALDDLYTKANTWIDPSYIDFGYVITDSSRTILASIAGICIKRNDKVSCIKAGNYAEEQTHVQQIFSDSSCTVRDHYVGCNASDFRCTVYDDGIVNCRKTSANTSCEVRPDGYVNCV